MDERVRFLLLCLLGAITVLALVGVVLLEILGISPPPILAAIIGGGMAALTTLLPPPRAPTQRGPIIEQPLDRGAAATIDRPAIKGPLP